MHSGRRGAPARGHRRDRFRVISPYSQCVSDLGFGNNTNSIKPLPGSKIDGKVPPLWAQNAALRRGPNHPPHRNGWNLWQSYQFLRFFFTGEAQIILCYQAGHEWPVRLN